MTQYDVPKRATRVRERASFSYDASSGELDLKEQILKLRAMRNSPYWNRSLADIAGMILLENVPKEIERYEQASGKRPLEVNQNGRQ